jgi:hypothetical protein
MGTASSRDAGQTQFASAPNARDEPWLNEAITRGSPPIYQGYWAVMKPFEAYTVDAPQEPSTGPRALAATRRSQEYEAMMIYMLAAAMTIAMLIATAFGIHQEAQRVRVKDNQKDGRGFGMRR